MHTLVTLGTPHHSTEQYPLGRIPEKLSIEGGNVPPEVYGSSLKFANYFYPRGDAFPGVQVVCLVGNAIVGRDLLAGDEAQQAQEGSVNRVQASGKLDAYFAFQGYKSGCGRGDVPGDGVTPIEIAHLPGAENVVLEGVWHGPQGSVERPWYGDVLHLWEKYLVPGYTSP